MTEIIKEKYFKQNYQNSSYIFHGSKQLLEVLNRNLAHDENGNKMNIQNAIYGSSVFIGAIPYAIKGRGKYDCSIGYNIDDLTMKITRGIVPEDDFGYIYVCDARCFSQCEDTCQYVSYESIKPLEIIKIYYKDFKDCFLYIDENKSEKRF